MVRVVDGESPSGLPGAGALNHAALAIRYRAIAGQRVQREGTSGTTSVRHECVPQPPTLRFKYCVRTQNPQKAARSSQLPWPRGGAGSPRARGAPGVWRHVRALRGAEGAGLLSPRAATHSTQPDRSHAYRPRMTIAAAASPRNGPAARPRVQRNAAVAQVVWYASRPRAPSSAPLMPGNGSAAPRRCSARRRIIESKIGPIISVTSIAGRRRAAPTSGAIVTARRLAPQRQRARAQP